MKRMYVFTAVLAILLAGCGTNTDPVQLLGISINKKSIELTEGESYQLRVWFDPEEAEEFAPKVVWESSKPKVASVDDDGKVKGVAEGSATITATCGKFEATCKVEVAPPPEPVPVEGISLNEISKDMFVGESFRLYVSYDPEESKYTADEIEWSSSDEGIATVDEGLVEAVGEGKATITAKCGDKEATCEVNVMVLTDEVAISQSKLTFASKGGEQKIKVYSRTPWTATYDSDWFSISPESGDGDSELTVTVSEGPGTKEVFIGTVSFTNETGFATVLTVVREGKTFVFSVSADTKVKFAPGNLIYQQSSNSWQFVEHQYTTYINSYTAQSTLWQDLFLCGTSGYNGTDPRSLSSADKVPDNTDINNTDYDWGHYLKIGSDPAGTWRLLTEYEFEYLLDSRPGHSDLTAYCKVGSQWGFVILPDGWENTSALDLYLYRNTFSSSQNNLSEYDWSLLESTGAIFLPFAFVSQTYTYYWTASTRYAASSGETSITAMKIMVDKSYNVTRSKSFVKKANHETGFVRLVQDVN